MNSYSYSSSRSYTPEIKPKDADQPKDTVSAIVWDRFNTNENIFFAASWDGFVRMYCLQATGNYNNNSTYNNNSNSSELTKGCEYFLHHPVLAIDISPQGILFAGLASGDVVAIEIRTGNIVALGNHDAPICGLFWVEEKGAIMSLGFDNLIKFWDVTGQSSPIVIELPLKTVTCSFDFPNLLIGSVQNTVLILNMKNLPNITKPSAGDYNKVQIQRFSKFMSSSINSANKVAVLGTIDGRNFTFDFKETYSAKIEITNHYIARVQKQTIKNNTYFGQVNSLDLGYYNHQHFLVCAGSEEIAIYNVVKKTKLKTVTQASSTGGAGTAIKVSPKQEYLAFSTGCDWTKGLYELEGIKKPKIAVIKFTNSELNTFVENK